MPIKHMLISAALLAIFAIGGTSLVAMTYQGTKEQIETNEREALLENLHALIEPRRHDNEIFDDYIQVTDRALLGSKDPVKIYRARKQGAPIAAVLAPVAPEGYGGDIRLLVAVRYDGTLEGVRVLNHKETPGLGDGIEIERSDWIRQFEGLSLDNTPEQKWRVKKDGGRFDQFTGATITPRAIVKAVHLALRYYEQHRQAIFDREATKEAEHG